MFNTLNAPSFEVFQKIQVDNGIGGFKETNRKVKTIRGYLDMLSSGEKTTFNAFIQESTHVLLTDYKSGLNNNMFIVDENKNVYEIDNIDNPVNLKHHIEIYLKLTNKSFIY